MECVLESSSLVVYENDTHILLEDNTKGKCDKISSYWYTDEDESVSVKGSELKVRKRNNQNLIVRTWSDSVLIGDSKTEGDLVIKFPEFLSVEGIVVVGSRTSDTSSYFTELDPQGNVFSFEDLIKGEEYEIYIQIDKKIMCINNITGIGEEDYIIRLDEFLPEYIQISKPDKLDEGVIHFKNNNIEKSNIYDIEKEYWNINEIIFMGNDNVFYDVEHIKSTSLIKYLVFRIFPDKFSPILLKNINNYINIKESRLEELVDIRIDYPDLMDKSIVFDSLDIKWDTEHESDVEEYEKYFEMNEDVIKKCVPGNRVRISFQHPNLNFSTIEILPRDRAMSRKHGLPWPHVIETSKIDSTIILNSIKTISVNIYTKTEDYVIVEKNSSKYHHSPEKLKSYDCRIGETLNIYMPLCNKSIEIGKSEIYSPNICITEDFSEG